MLTLKANQLLLHKLITQSREKKYELKDSAGLETESPDSKQVEAALLP